MLSICAVFLSLTGIYAQSKADSTTCSRVKDGVYKIISPTAEGKNIEYLITRKGDTQTEYIKDFGLKLEFTVTWTDPCTYVLSKPRVVEGQSSALDEEMEVTVHIIAITAKLYKAKVTSNLYEAEEEMDIFSVK